MRTILSAFLLLTLLVPVAASAQTDIFVRGSGKLYPIAVPQLCLKSGESEVQRVIPGVITKNLDLSGYFEVLNSNSYIETPGKCESEGFAYTDWSVIGAEGLVRGVVEQSGEQITVKLYLHDVQRKRVVLGKEYQGSAAQARNIAHRFSNEIVKFFTGEMGIFGTRIAFSSRVGRFKELFMMDLDGGNLRTLTNEKGLAMAPAWGPQGEKLIYTSYARRVPELFLMDVSSRQIRQLTSGRELEIGGDFSPDGRTIVTSVSSGKQSDIVLLRTDGTPLRKLTSRYGVIDVSPKFSPDGQQVIFTSNRAGGPQIYTMTRDGSGVKRVSFVRSNYCTSPDWSPRGDRIVFVCRSDGGFNLYSAKPNGTDPLQLTSRGNNEDPEWSPNGKLIVFATTFGRTGSYNLAIINADGSNFRLITENTTDDTDPTWSPLPQ